MELLLGEGEITQPPQELAAEPRSHAWPLRDDTQRRVTSSQIREATGGMAMNDLCFLVTQGRARDAAFSKKKTV